MHLNVMLIKIVVILQKGNLYKFNFEFRKGSKRRTRYWSQKSVYYYGVIRNRIGEVIANPH